MLLSTSNARKGSTSVGERRESAPPASRPSTYSPLSSPISGIAGGDQQPRPRPRSNSHVQIPLYSQASYQRPLPALPSAAGAHLSSGDAVKVPVDNNGAQSSLPSPHIMNSNRLHPKSSFTAHRHSPQLMPQDTTHDSQDFVSGGPGAALPDTSPLEYQAPVRSNGSGSRNYRGEGLSFVPVQAQEQVHPLEHGCEAGYAYGKLLQGHGCRIGHEEGQGSGQQFIQKGQVQRQQKNTDDAGRGSRTPSERSLLQHHLTNLLQDETAKHGREPSPLPSSSSSSLSSSSYVAVSSSFTGYQQRCPPLSNHEMSISSSTSAGPLSSFSSPPLLNQNNNSHFQSSFADLQPYYPPPSASSDSTSQHLLQYNYTTDSSELFSGLSTASTPATLRTSTSSMTASKSTTLTPHRSGSSYRRHSSGVRPLSIKTQHAHAVKRGPSTGEVGNPGTRYLDPDGSAQGSERNYSRSNLTSSRQLSPSPSTHLPPRQSPNHLIIPQHSHISPKQSTHFSHHQSHPHQRFNQTSPNQHQSQRHQQQEYFQKSSAARSPRSTSPVSPGHHEDRAAMTLMQQYLTQPDDPDSEADIAMQILISQAAVDSKGFDVLVPQTLENIKRHHATLSSRIAALTARLSLESKIREAAQSLLKLHAGNKKLARQASDHLEAANRKVDQVATELWKLTQLAADLQRTLLQHTCGVLALGVVRLEDQGRREREAHAIQIQEARLGQDVEEQFESMAKVIMNLEEDALEAQSLLEDKDRAIERLMKQLEHQRDLFAKLDDQQQRTMALSRSQQKNLDALSDSNDAKAVAELKNFLSTVQQQLQRILQQQQQQPQEQHRQQRRKEISSSHSAEGNETENYPPQDRSRTAQAWPSESTLMSKVSALGHRQDNFMGRLREDSVSSGPSDGNNTIGTATVSETLVRFKAATPPGGNASHASIEGIRSTLDALESHVVESQQKLQTLEGELGLLRRQSVVMSASRNNSIKIKNFSVSRGQAEETIRSALEKSLKDALLAKEMAQQELENERQRWQDDQNNRISALEESLVAVEDFDKALAKDAGSDADNEDLLRDEAVRELRRQLRDAIDEIDHLSQQQQSSLKSMRQLFDLIPDSRRKSHMQLYSSHQQLQQQIATSPGCVSGRASPAGSTFSLPSTGAIGFSMEALIGRVKELVARSQQVEQDNLELRQQVGKPTMRSRPNSSQNLQSLVQHQDSRAQSTWILKSDLERLQASAGMVQLLEKELELLKQHTDVLLDENARLADLAAASATNTPAPMRSNVFGGMIQKQSRDDTVDELQHIIRVKDKLIQERDQFVEEQEKALNQARFEITQIKSNAIGARAANDDPSALSPLSAFDVSAVDDLRSKCSKLEEEIGEMRMVIVALESMSGGPGSGSQLLKSLAVSSKTHSPTSTSWFGSSLSAVGSLSFGSLSHNQSTETPSGVPSPLPSAVDIFHSGGSSGVLSPGGSTTNNAVVAGATAALRKEFRRAMGELRDEKEKAVKKEVEERRRIERELRQLRRELQIIQVNEHA